MILNHTHIGAYGICRFDDKILLAKKTRGPYKGQWDLPGGGINFTETFEEAIKREFLEETKYIVKNISILMSCSNVVNYTNSDGNSEMLHHLGVIYNVEIDDHSKIERKNILEEDVEISDWISLCEINLTKNMLTPFAYKAIKEHMKINLDN